MHLSVAHPLRISALLLGLHFGLSGCSPVRLDLGRLPDASQSVETDAGPEPSRDAGACAKACLGGRACVAGECLPHWIPVEGAEIANDAPRVGHFAVWTGTEVIVWGGHDPRTGRAASVFGDGFRFDPVHDTMRVLSGTQSPPARFRDGEQTAVWTGREMIVWGGRSASGALSDGWAYVPESDRWRPLGSAPFGAASLTVVFTGTDLLVWSERAPGASGLRFDLSTGLWMPTVSPSTLQQRRGHSAIWTGTEMVAWGGREEGGDALRDGWRYLPSRERWRAVDVSTAPEGRWDHTAVWSGEEMLIFGGASSGNRVLSLGAAYVPAADRWRALSLRGSPSARVGHVAVWDGREMIVWGGTDGTEILSDGARYDPVDDAWRPVEGSPLVGGRNGAQAVWTGAELIVVGGDNGEARLDPIAWRYQP